MSELRLYQIINLTIANQNYNKSINRIYSFIQQHKNPTQHMIWDILQQSTFNAYFSPPQVDTLTIQTLLLDENIITEFKNMNPQLIQYITQHKDLFISKLIQYTITLPSVNDSQDRIKKLPYVSSELLAIDNEIVYGSLLNSNSNKDYFLQLMNIFHSQSCRNEILMGYFLKIVTNLYKCQKKTAVQKIYQNRQLLYQHLNDESVGAVFQMFLILLQTEQGYMINERKQVATKIIDSLVEQPQPIKSVCKNILNEVIAKFQTFSSGDQLKDHIIYSEKLLKVFEISNSESIDKFVIGYLTKALQRICTAGDEKKSLLQIPQKHKKLIASFINLKKHLLENNSSGQSFKNQTQKEVHRFSKSLSIYLAIIKLALQNSIVGFLNQHDIQALFDILAKHSTNDIVKVKIFDIFTLVFTKKDQFTQSILTKYFYDQSIRLFEQDQKMYGYFLFLLWKNVNKKIKNPPSQDQIEKWDNLLKYFQTNQNHQMDAQKVVDRYSNRTKVVKLVVDEQDVGPANVDYKLDSKPEIKAKTQEKKAETTKFDIFSPVTTFPTKVDVTTKLKTDPFAAFDFFGNTPKKQLKKQEKKQQKKQQKKKADFSDFASFF